MKTDHHHASTWLQNPRGPMQQRPQIVQFAVYEDSKSLKSSGRRMNSPLVIFISTRIHWPGRGRYYLGKMCRRSYRPRPDNGSGDSPRPPFLSEFVNHIGKLALVEVVYHLFGGPLATRVHPHVERSIRLKTKSAHRIVKLQTAHSDV